MLANIDGTPKLHIGNISYILMKTSQYGTTDRINN